MFKRLILLVMMLSSCCLAAGLEEEFCHPSGESKVAVFWFWANTVTKEGITRDLEAMKQAGIGRAVLSVTAAHSATVKTGGVVFLSPEWLALFRYALDEAERLDIKISAVMSNGWYQGAPWVKPEMGAQMLVWSETSVTGPASFSKALPTPDKFRAGWKAEISAKAKASDFKTIAVLAFLQNNKGELIKDSMVRLDDKVQANGALDWAAPDGKWCVFRFAYVPNFVPMKQDSPGFTGLQIDHLSAKTMEMFFNKVGLPMLEAAGPHAGKTLDFFHEDSIELGSFDWTHDFLEQFTAHRNYDLIPWMPVLAGKKFAGEPQADRVENDFATTVDELLADEHYGTFSKLCREHGLKLQTEGGDLRGSLHVKGAADLPMGEFWNSRPTKRDSRYIENSNNLRGFNPNAVIASHIYGAGRVSFESFTTAKHWEEYPAMLKPMADEIYCLGANHLTLHGYSYSRPETPRPGDVYFAGTHFNPGVTWWKYAGEFFTYLNRCQTMLSAGQPVTDILYVDGPETQFMIQSNESRSMTVLGKCDVIPDDLLVSQLKMLPGGRVGLANGASYAVLAVANTAIEPAALQKIVQLVNEGAVVWLRAVPKQSPGRTGYPEADKAIATCLETLGADRSAGVYTVGKGKVILGEMPVKEMLAHIGLASDFSYTPADGQPFLDYAHRQVADDDIYFVASWTGAWRQADCVFRTTGKKPEFWNPVTGERTPCLDYKTGDGSVRLSLKLPPYGSTFVVFRENSPPAKPAPVATGILPAPISITGPWTLQFTPDRIGVPSFEITSPDLFLWNENPDTNIQSFAGTASYHSEFTVSKEWLEKNRRAFLDLGTVHDLAEILVNGKSMGVVWTAPFRANVASALQTGRNTLEIRVVNTWYNWKTLTNYNPLTLGSGKVSKKTAELLPAGLLGPVILTVE
jgi:hypothetical protein